MFCKKCGKELADGSNFCPFCGENTAAGAQPQQQPQQQAQQQFTAPAKSDNRKTYSILAYIPLLFLIGLLAKPEKDDPRVRFNVGQGIILSIFFFGGEILLSIISSIIKLCLGFSYIFSPISIILSVFFTLLGLTVLGFTIYFCVTGIINVNKDKDGYLPFIGKFSFYK